jgi:hypothetical protein
VVFNDWETPHPDYFAADTREKRIAFVQADLERREAADRAVERALPQRPRRRTTGPSIVFSIRLDPAEVRLLEERSAVLAIKPTVLARNLIRIGLATPARDGVPLALDRVQAALDELRGLMP